MSENEFTFRTVNEWCVCDANGTKIVPCRDGRISHVSPRRGKCRVGADAEEWLDEHPRERGIYHDWLRARRAAADAWKHETPHHRYVCDAGCLAVRVNGAKLMVGNSYGDGNFPVYLLRDSRTFNADAVAPDVLPYAFDYSGLSVESDDGLDLEVLDYDCAGGRVLEKIRVKSASFLRDGSGAVVVKYTEAV